MDVIHLIFFNMRDTNVLLEVMGRFKGDNGDIIHIIPLANITYLGIRICMWLERLAALLKEKGKNNFPDFCDMEGYMLSVADIDSMFYPTLEEIQIHRNINLADCIPRGLNVWEHYQCNLSFRRGAEKHALDNGVKENVINFFHMWSEYKESEGKQPGFNMLENYATGTTTRYLQLRFVNNI